jgi:hypothetical protein
MDASQEAIREYRILGAILGQALGEKAQGQETLLQPFQSSCQPSGRIPAKEEPLQIESRPSAPVHDQEQSRDALEHEKGGDMMLCKTAASASSMHWAHWDSGIDGRLSK